MREDMRMSVDENVNTPDATDSSTVQAFENDTEDWGVDWMSSSRKIWDEEFSPSANEQLANQRRYSRSRSGSDAGGEMNDGTMVNRMVRWFNRRHF
jgi:hypothetical protein